MKQVIRYLYEYENGNRIRNVGFIKLEKRMDKCAIHIHGKNLDFGQKKKLEVFVFYVQGGDCIGIPQGVIEGEAPMINYILKFEPEDAGGQEMFDKLAGIILRNASEKTYAAMWEEEAADVEHMTTGQREVLEEAATEAMPEEAATEAVPEERQQSEEPKVRESLIEHVEKLVEQQEFQEEIEKYIPPKTRTYEKIQRQDIARLPRTQWHLANNSFLLHGYYNYQMLLFGYMEGEARQWFLGIPGVFSNQEQLLAGIFGFPEFRTKQVTRQKTGEFGYWYRYLDMRK